MKGPELLTGLWRLLEEVEGEPTVALVLSLARKAGLKVRTELACTILQPLLGNGAREISENFPHEGKSFPGNARETFLARAPADLKGIIYRANGEIGDVTSSLRSEALTRARSWVTELAEGMEDLPPRELRTLTSDERFTLARYHAAVFAYCNRSERNNRTKAQTIAVGIKNLTERLGRRRALADVTVREYLVYGCKIMARRENAPWFRPVDVYELIDLEPA